MENVKKAIKMLSNDWSENWDIVVDTFGQELADLFEKAILEVNRDETINGIKDKF